MSVPREFIEKKIIRASSRLKMKCPEEGIRTKQMSEKWASTVALIYCLVHKPKKSKVAPIFVFALRFFIFSTIKQTFSSTSSELSPKVNVVSITDLKHCTVLEN